MRWFQKGYLKLRRACIPDSEGDCAVSETCAGLPGDSTACAVGGTRLELFAILRAAGASRAGWHCLVSGLENRTLLAWSCMLTVVLVLLEHL